MHPVQNNVDDIQGAAISPACIFIRFGGWTRSDEIATIRQLEPGATRRTKD